MERALLARGYTNYNCRGPLLIHSTKGRERASFSPCSCYTIHSCRKAPSTSQRERKGKGVLLTLLIRSFTPATACYLAGSLSLRGPTSGPRYAFWAGADCTLAAKWDKLHAPVDKGEDGRSVAAGLPPRSLQEGLLPSLGREAPAPRPPPPLSLLLLRRKRIRWN